MQGSARGRGRKHGGGRAALPTAPGFSPPANQKNLREGVGVCCGGFFFSCKLIFRKLQHFSESAFFSPPFKTLKFPFCLNSRLEVLALCWGKKKKKRNRRGNKRQQTKPKQTNIKKQRKKHDTNSAMSLRLICFIFRKTNQTKTPSKSTIKEQTIPVAAAVRPAHPGSGSCLYYYLLALLFSFFIPQKESFDSEHPLLHSPPPLTA